MTNHKSYYEDLVMFRKELRTDLSKRKGALAREMEDGRFSAEYLRQRQDEVTAYEKAIRPSLRDRAKIMRDRYVSDLWDDYGPTKARTSEGIRNALESGLHFSVDEYKMLAAECKTDFDRRLLMQHAEDHGITLKCGLTMQERLDRYDKYTALLTDTPEGMDLYEMAPESFERMRNQEAYEIFQHCDELPPVICFETPTTFEGLAGEIDAEKAAARTDDTITDAEEDAFRQAAEYDASDIKAAEANVRTVEAMVKARQEAERHKAEKDRKEVEIMTEALNNASAIKAEKAAEETATSTTD